MKTNLFTLLIVVFFGQQLFSQNKDCDCDYMTKSKINNVYKRHWNKGLKIVHQQSGTDYMQLIIDNNLDGATIKQMCIDAWWEINQNGVNYTYNRYKRRHSDKMNKKDYLNDICVLEMLSRLNVMIREKL